PTEDPPLGSLSPPPLLCSAREVAAPRVESRNLGSLFEEAARPERRTKEFGDGAAAGTNIAKLGPMRSDAARPTRFAGLDGLRGLAAFSVFLGHTVRLIPGPRLSDRLMESPLRVLWDGTAAVDLFFVLSGFVLSLPFVGPGRQRLHLIG